MKVPPQGQSASRLVSATAAWQFGQVAGRRTTRRISIPRCGEPGPPNGCSPVLAARHARHDAGPGPVAERLGRSTSAADAADAAARRRCRGQVRRDRDREEAEQLQRRRMDPVEVAGVDPDQAARSDEQLRRQGRARRPGRPARRPAPCSSSWRTCSPRRRPCGVRFLGRLGTPHVAPAEAAVIAGSRAPARPT